MKLEIKNKKNNPLLSRIEVSGVLTFEGATPSNAQVAQDIAAQLKVEPSVVKMKKITTGVGSNQADFTAFVYSSKEELDRIEPKPKKQLEKEQKAAEAKKKAEEEAKSAEKKEEAPKEEKKEEAKPEVKKAPKEEKKEGAE